MTAAAAVEARGLVKEFEKGRSTLWQRLRRRPDMRTKLISRVVGDDSIATEIEFYGTNTGPMSMGGVEIPPTNKSVVGRGSYIARVKDGKVVEFRSHPDAAGMMMQLGLVPPL